MALMSPEEKAIFIEQMHVACRKIRLGIARLDADVPMDESTLAQLSESVDILNKVIEGLQA